MDHDAFRAPANQLSQPKLGLLGQPKPKQAAKQTYGLAVVFVN